MIKPIRIHKGDSTIFGNVDRFLTFNIDTSLDLTGYSAKFILCSVVKNIKNINSKKFDIVLTPEETQNLRDGIQYGSIVFTDNKGNVKTIINTIPFEITTAVVENEYQEIDLTIPQSSGVDIKLKVGMSGVTSINGMTGDVVLDIPKIDGLATKQQLTQGLGTKQDKGDYALRSEIPNITNLATKTEVDAKQDKGDYALKEEIPDLTDYVKNTDYASTSGGAGLIKTSSAYGTQMVDAGFIRAGVDTLEPYKTRGVNFFIGKGTLENIKDDYVKRGLIENETELTADEKANVKAWLGYADSTDIMQAIASIPQFNLSIVDALPSTGEKMTLYLVPKEGTNNDVYDEYIWIEQTSSFEHLGTTAVDLTDYVKNTDYATADVGGVVKVTGNHGLAVYQGMLIGSAKTFDSYNASANNLVISKGTLENIKDNFVKRGLTENALEFTDDEKTSARTLIGAVGSTDYAGATTGGAGVVKCSSTFACGCVNGYIQAMNIPTLERYNNLSQYAFIGKATLQTALTEYSKTVLTTEADYEALETKDANTLYLIEE